MQTPTAIPEIYDKTTLRLHWATAFLVAFLWLIGRTVGFLPRGAVRIDIWSLHIVLGFALAGIVIVRIGWRATRGRRLPAAEHGIRHVLATAVHGLLYLLLLTIIGLGVTNAFAHAFPLFNLWNFPKLGDDAFMHRINTWHGLVANILAATALLHAIAALFHHYILKDAVLRRMWPSVGAPG